MRKRTRFHAMLHFRVTESMRDRLWRVCEERDLLQSWVLRRALERELVRLELERERPELEREGEIDRL